MAFCPTCGTGIVHGSSFCGNCGSAAPGDVYVGYSPGIPFSYAPVSPPTASWRFTSIGTGPTVSWILYFAGVILQALSFACRWGNGLRIGSLISTAAAITVVVGLGFAFRALRSSGMLISVILLVVGFSLVGLSQLVAFIAINDFSYATWNTSIFIETIGGLTLAAGFFFLIFRPVTTKL